MKQLTHLIRPDLIAFSPYSSARDEAVEGKVWLNANESPYDIEIAAGLKINRYPEKQPQKLITRLTEIFNVANDQIIVSRGSDEMIDLLIRLFCVYGKDCIMTCSPSYGMYSVYARLQGANVIEVPLLKNNNFQLDVASMVTKKNENIKLIFLCSPNNPTGNLLNKDDIIYLCQQFANKSIVVVDEAYIDYANSTSLTSLINQYENLVILRTFSKAYRLAGARLGCLLANKNIIQWLLKIIAPYPLPSPTSKFALEMLSEKNILEIQQQIENIKFERQKLFTALSSMPNISKVWTSEANYLLLETKYCKEIMAACGEQGIIIRSMMDKPNLTNCLRISIGLPEENLQILNIFQEYM